MGRKSSSRPAKTSVAAAAVLGAAAPPMMGHQQMRRSECTPGKCEAARVPAVLTRGLDKSFRLLSMRLLYSGCMPGFRLLLKETAQSLPTVFLSKVTDSLLERFLAMKQLLAHIR